MLKIYINFKHILKSIMFPLIGMVYAAEDLDFEQQQTHELIIRATDSVTGVFAEVPVSIIVEDVNDCPPEFSSDSYHVNVSEAATFGTLLIKLDAHDNDTGYILTHVYLIFLIFLFNN